MTSQWSRLKKKHLSICYHSVWEAIASGTIVVDWVASANNWADVYTKIFSGEALRLLARKILFPQKLK